MNPTEFPYRFECALCGEETTIFHRGQYNAMDKLESTTGWRILPRGSYFAKVYCPEHADAASREPA